MDRFVQSKKRNGTGTRNNTALRIMLSVFPLFHLMHVCVSAVYDTTQTKTKCTERMRLRKK